MANHSLHHYVNNLWYGNNKLAYLLSPLSGLFGIVAGLRKRKQLSKQLKFPVPVIVVGNITVGGTGKTPMVSSLAIELQNRGFKVGVASRGYHGNTYQPTLLNKKHTAEQVGDEPLLILQKTNANIMVGSDRVKVINSLIEQCQCDVVICDDGLQDYRFRHDIEIVMVDGERVFGNQKLLPAGPLRERVARIQQADFIVATGEPIPAISSDCMKLSIQHAVDLADSENFQPLTKWQGQCVHVVAGISNPQRFFSALRDYAIELIEHEFPDHAALSNKDVVFPDQIPVFMSEKDAVKCRQYYLTNTWVVPLYAELPNEFIVRVIARLQH